MPPDRSPRAYPLPAADALVHQFMRTAAAGVIRLLLEDVPLPEAESLQDTALRHWLAALAGDAPATCPRASRASRRSLPPWTAGPRPPPACWATPACARGCA